MQHTSTSLAASRRPVALRGILVALAASLTLALGAGAASAASYVALGDSYSADSLVLPQDLSSPLCLRSQINYPKLSAAARGLSLTDVTCGAATTEHMLLPQWPGVAPQFDALRSDTDVVTLGIGGNDNGLFIGAIATCGAIDIAWPGTPFDIGAPCRDLNRALFFANADAIRAKISLTIQGIKRRSPSAKVLVVGYPRLLPDRGRCYPTLPLTSGDIAFLDQLEQRLNASIAGAAAANGVTYVDLYTPSYGRDACKPVGTRWVDPLVPTLWDGSLTPIHPNRAGAAAQAVQVTAALQAAGF